MEGRKLDGTSALVGVLAGCAAGLGAGYLLGRYVSKRSAEREIARETEAVRDHYRAKADAPGSRDYSGHTGANPPVGIARRAFSDLRLTAEGGLPETGIISVSQGPVDPDGEDEDVDEDEDEDDEDGDPADFRDAEKIGTEVRNRASMIYVIPAEEFFDETGNYQKISITYFEADQVLVDDRKNPIPNPYNVCGNFREGFGKDPVNPHISYVRNDKIRVDFEIAMEEGTFAESMNYGRPP